MRLIGAVLVLLLAVGLAVAEAGGLTKGPLVKVSGTSPFASCTADDVPSQPGTNYPNSEIEPWVTVNPANLDNIVGEYQQDRWSDGGARGLVAGVSFDGGTTWQNVVIPKITLCSGGTPQNGGDYERASDPWVSFGPTGILHQVALTIDGTTNNSGILVSRSTDGGLNWSNPITLIKDTSSLFFNDKESITADSTNANNAYVVWDRLDFSSTSVRGGRRPGELERARIAANGPTWFSRTTNGGVSWEAAHPIYNTGFQTLSNQIVVLPNGRLLNYFLEFVGAANIRLIRSNDKGVTWSGVIGSPGSQDSVGVVDPDTFAPIRTGDIVPDIAVDPVSGTLYAAWQDSRFSGFSIDEVAFSQSTDGGMTWSAPVKVNLTPTGISLRNRQAFTASVTVANGVVGVTYYDFRRNDPGTTSLETDYFLVHCHRNCTNPANWRETRLSGKPFNMRRAPVARGNFVGDYEGLANAGSDFAAFWVQTKGTDPGNAYFRRAGP